MAPGTNEERGLLSNVSSMSTCVILCLLHAVSTHTLYGVTAVFKRERPLFVRLERRMGVLTYHDTC